MHPWIDYSLICILRLPVVPGAKKTGWHLFSQVCATNCSCMLFKQDKD